MKKRFTALFCVILSVCLLLGSAVSDTKVTVSPSEGGNGQDVAAAVDGGVSGTHTDENAFGITIDGSNPTDFLTIDGEDLYAQLASVDDPVSVSVTAESVSESTEGSVDAYGISVFADTLSADVTVKGDVSAQTVNTDRASSHGVDVIATNGKEITVDVAGNVTAGAKGDYNGEAVGVSASANGGGKTTVTVGGNVTAVSKSDDLQVSSFGIDGEATGNGSALEITVGGDVSGRGTDGNGDTAGYGMNLKNEDGAATDVVVGGTVAGDIAAVRLQFTGQDDPDAISLTAWKVEENGEGKLVEAAGMFQDAEEQKKAETDFEARINYIVRVQDKVKNMLGVLGGGTVSLGGNTYATAAEDEDVALTVNLGSGVALDGVYYNAEDTKTLTKTDSLKQNSDGQYLVKMLRGGGMLLGLASHTHAPADAVQENRTEPTCETEGSYDKVVRCSICKKELSRETITLDKLPHTEETVEENRVEPTCEAEGSYDKVVRCSVCEKELSRETITLDKLPHTEETVEENRVEPTCAKAGSYEKVVKCSVCGEEISRENVPLDKLGHTEETAEENRVEPTCAKAGSYEKVVKCSVCGEEISRETITLDKLPHTEAISEENRVEPTCTRAGSYEQVVKCSVCGEEISREKVTLPAAGHQPYSGYYNYKEPTDTEDGGYDIVSRCSVCRQVLGVDHCVLSRKTKSITVNIIWVNDNDDADKNRPDAVTVRLLADGKEVRNASCSVSSYSSAYTFTNLPSRNEAGKEIQYTVMTDPVEFYAAEVSGLDIYLKYQPELIQQSVKIVWDDENNRDQKRPDSVWVKLTCEAGKWTRTVLLNEANGWTATVTEMPAFFGRKPAEYSVVCQSVIGYQEENRATEDKMTTITLKLWTRPGSPSQGDKPRTAPDTIYVFEEYDTPL